MTQPLILTIDDDPDLAAIIGLYVVRWGFRSESVESAAALDGFLDQRIPEVMLMDVQLGDADGSQLVAEVKRRLPAVPVIMITRNTSLDAAVRCMKHGASDFITKPIDFERLERAIREALEVGRLAALAEAPRVPAQGSSEEPDQRSAQESGRQPDEMIGDSPPMRELYRLISRVAPTDVPALILGETGTGKELVARAIHAQSGRRGGPFVAVNAAAIPRELIESALFGHEEGAFTGARRDHLGYCEQADGGTLLLDEIDEMEFDVQAKLLRFLQDHVVQRVGAQVGRKVDVRVVAATNVDPIQQIADGRLREDLYYRLRVVSLRLPPLAERGDDVGLLAEHFLARTRQRYNGELETIAPAAHTALKAYSWPGNVRQLENVIQESVVLHPGPVLEAVMLPTELLESDGAPTSTASRSVADRPLRAKELAERATLVDALEAADGHPETAATTLGISRATIYRKIKKYGLKPSG